MIKLPFTVALVITVVILSVLKLLPYDTTGPSHSNDMEVLSRWGLGILMIITLWIIALFVSAFIVPE